MATWECRGFKEKCQMKDLIQAVTSFMPPLRPSPKQGPQHTHYAHTHQASVMIYFSLCGCHSSPFKVNFTHINISDR